jgi:hypothetical protein
MSRRTNSAVRLAIARGLSGQARLAQPIDVEIARIMELALPNARRRFMAAPR